MLYALVILKPPPSSHPWKKCSFMKPVSCAKKVGDHCYRVYILHAQSFSWVWIFAIPWTIAPPGSSVHGILQEYWNGCHILLQEIFPGINPHLLCLMHWKQILECEVKWALESITTNKASGGDGIVVELFQILKDDVVKVLDSICQEIWKIQQWPQDWKSKFSFQSQKKAMPKNVQTTAQLHSSHMLAK